MFTDTWRRLFVFAALVFTIGVRTKVRGDEDASGAIRSLQEQVNALLDHRQQDYNALEESLKRAIEKNTELFVLKNEIKQLRKEVNDLRGGNGNEAKNERLRVRWLGNAVTELQGEVAEVLRTRNASEELAERSRIEGEVALLKGDVAAVGRGIRNLGGRIAKIEAVLGTTRVDIVAVKERFSQLSRSCADIASQLSSVQIEMRSLKCDSSSTVATNSVDQQEPDVAEADGERGGKTTTTTDRAKRKLELRRYSRRHVYSRRGESYRTRMLEDRLKNLERKVSLGARKRVLLERRYAGAPSSLTRRVKSLEKAWTKLTREISNVSENVATAVATAAAAATKTFDDSLATRLTGSLTALEDAVEANSTSIKDELARLGVNAARKAAELSLTREELNNLRRTVQALSVSASKLQERSDKQQETLDRLKAAGTQAFASPPPPPPASPSHASAGEVVQLEDRYHLIRDNLTTDCRRQSAANETASDATTGLRLIRGEKAGRPMLVYCRNEWIVIARRTDGTVDFDRTWNDYSLGFGSPLGEYWIGNEMLRELTRDDCSQLRIDMIDIRGERWRAEYETFAVDAAETGYRLRVHGYRGNATDALSYQNGMAFSAKDRDMDASHAHCAQNYHGGWWFSRCQHANLNGKYSLGLTWFRADTGRWMSIVSSEMSVRRGSGCRSR